MTYTPHTRETEVLEADARTIAIHIIDSSAQFSAPYHDEAAHEAHDWHDAPGNHPDCLHCHLYRAHQAPWPGPPVFGSGTYALVRLAARILREAEAGVGV